MTISTSRAATEDVPTARTVSRLVELDRTGRAVHIGAAAHRIGDDQHAVADLTVWLYATLHAGNPGIFSNASILPDVDFEQRIRGSVRDVGIVVPLDHTVRRSGTATDRSLVELHRVRLRVSEAELAAEPGPVGAVRLPCSRPNLSPGFFMYVHDTGSLAASAPVIRLYVRHEDPEQALEDWSACIDDLTSAGLSFRTKILSRRSAYPRNDALVFYAAEHAGLVQDVVTAPALARRRSGVDPQGSPLCAAVGDGVSRAEDPRDPTVGPAQQSFGEHRCGVLARALVEAAATGRDVADAVEEACGRANVDPADLSRNLHVLPAGASEP